VIVIAWRRAVSPIRRLGRLPGMPLEHRQKSFEVGGPSATEMLDVLLDAVWIVTVEAMTDYPTAQMVLSD
jgi:hypothetical protein